MCHPYTESATALSDINHHFAVSVCVSFWRPLLNLVFLSDLPSGFSFLDSARCVHNYCHGFTFNQFLQLSPKPALDLPSKCLINWYMFCTASLDNMKTEQSFSSLTSNKPIFRYFLSDLHAMSWRIQEKHIQKNLVEYRWILWRSIQDSIYMSYL